MKRYAYKQNAYYLIYIIRCVLHDKIPAKEKLDKMDLDQFYQVAHSHSLTAIAAYALESAGIYDKAFTEAKNKAIRKNIVLDVEREKVFAEFEKAGIWHMPLKGIILKEYYPNIGMRQMADNDILCDETKMDKVKGIMESCGFKTMIYGKTHQDVYYKQPVCNFEIHSRLFEPYYSKTYQYYKQIKDKLLKCQKNSFEFYFSNEDFYIFMIAHEYKHFHGTGTGLRSLLDTYVFLTNNRDNLDWKYIYLELEKLALSDFEKNNRELAINLFDNKLLKDEKELLDYYIFSGTYGVINNRIHNSIGSDASFVGKVKYAAKRAMVSEDVMKEFYPFFYSHKLFRPLLYFYKVIYKLCTNAGPMLREIKELIRYK